MLKRKTRCKLVFRTMRKLMDRLMRGNSHFMPCPPGDRARPSPAGAGTRPRRETPDRLGVPPDPPRSHPLMSVVSTVLTYDCFRSPCGGAYRLRAKRRICEGCVFLELHSALPSAILVLFGRSSAGRRSGCFPAHPVADGTARFVLGRSSGLPPAGAPASAGADPPDARLRPWRRRIRSGGWRG